MAARWRRRRRDHLILGVGAGMVAVAVVATLTPLTWSSPTIASRPHRAAPEAPDPIRVTAAKPARRAGSVVPERPRSVRLPDGTVVPIRAVGTRPDGVLDVPSDVRSAGWWRGGSRLGDPLGSTLLAAHVDSTSQGLGPYVALLRVHPGQRLELRSLHLRQSFRVTSLRLVPQGPLRGHSRISGSSGARRLTLVTCAPPYDRSHGGYQNLAVVTAVPVGPPQRTTG